MANIVPYSEKENRTDINMKDSKSCGDLNSRANAGCGSSLRCPTEDLRTSHMCAQLCSLMKAQLLKTYEEVVFRYGGHFDMSLMQSCQVREFIFYFFQRGVFPDSK